MRKKAICTSFMYSLSGIAITSASVSWSAFFVFQLLASLASFLGITGMMVVAAWFKIGIKLFFAAVEAKTWVGGGGTSAAILAALEFFLCTTGV